jgi:glycerol-3-phosphate dehydrogenase
LPLEGAWRCGVAMPLRGGRVALGIPWQGMLMLGTTDTAFTGDPADVAVTREDVRTVLNEASLFLADDLLEPRQVRFAIAGLRALPVADCKTADARRGHVIEVSANGLVSVAGGKLTTHRLIAIDALRRLPYAHIGRLDADDSRLPGTGWSLRVEANRSLEPDVADHLERLYGDEAGRVLDLAAVLPDGLDRIHPSGPDVWAQVDYAFESEWARTAEDVARRRTTLAMRGLFTDAIRERMATLAPSAQHSVVHARA